MSLMGRTKLVLPNISDVPTGFTLSKDKSLPLGLLELMAKAGHMRRSIPAVMPGGPEELLIKSFNLWLKPRSRHIDGWVGIDASVSLADDTVVLRLTPTNCGYFAAFDRYYYESLAAKSPELGLAFYSLITRSLQALGYIYDLGSAHVLQERMQEMREEELAYAEANGGGTEDSEDQSFLDFSAIPASFNKPMKFAQAFAIIQAENQQQPSPVLHSLLRLAVASRKAVKPRPAYRRTDTAVGDDYDPDDQSCDVPIVLFPFAENSVVEHAFDEESQYFNESESGPLIKMQYTRGMTAKQVSSELALLRRWLHALTLTVALSRQIEKVQKPAPRYWQ